jgi:glycosyltransferase involved in cell wall biosynthesis
MLGHLPGRAVKQDAALADRFRAEGFDVTVASHHEPTLRRLADLTATPLRQRGRSDVAIVSVYSGRGFAQAEASSLAARLAGQRVVLVLHGGSLPDFARARPARWRVGRLLQGADAVVAPSPYLQCALTWARPDIRVVPNVIDLDRYPFRHRSTLRPRLLWMRSFHDVYDPTLAVEALARVRRARPDTTLTMAGEDKGLRTRVVERAQALDLLDTVAFPGVLDLPGKIAAFDEHDVFLNTNTVDNMPVTLVEAAAFGTPIVSTDVGGVPDLVHHRETALLVPPRDPDALAVAVLELLADPDLAGQLSTAARQVAEASSWARVLPAWLDVFASID